MGNDEDVFEGGLRASLNVLPAEHIQNSTIAAGSALVINGAARLLCF